MDRIIEAINELTTDLITAHQKEIKTTWGDSEDAEIGLSFRANLKGSFDAPLVDVRMSFSRKFTDSAQKQLDDPNQTTMDLQ